MSTRTRTGRIRVSRIFSQPIAFLVAWAGLLGLLAPACSTVEAEPANTPTAILPWPWVETSIGTATDPGAVLYDGSYVLSNLGADIGSAADQFKFVGQPLCGDGALVVKIASVASADGWSRCGLMMRESVATNARNVLLSLTTANGLVFTSRQLVNGSTALRASALSQTPPVWLKLARAGDTFTAAFSADGHTWTVQGSETIAMPEQIQVGVAYANRSPSVWAIGVGENLQLTTPIDTDGNGLPDTWELHYFGHLGVLPGADADGDGFTNAEEWLRGTHPALVTSAEQRPALAIVSGNDQRATVGSIVPQPLVVRVVDGQTGAPLPGLLVSFRLAPGQGFLGVDHGWSSSAEALSDAEGRAQIYLKFSDQGGPVKVTSSLGNQPGGTAVFTLNALLGEPGAEVQLTPMGIGVVSPASQNRYSAGVYTVEAATGDINGSADSFNFSWQRLSGDG